MMGALEKLRRWLPSAPWRRVDFYTVAYHPDRACQPYAVINLTEGGAFEVEYPHSPEPPPETPPGNLRAAMSAVEASWTEHRRTLQMIDATIEESNRRV